MNSGNYIKYLWQQPEWPTWTFDAAALTGLLSCVHMERGRLLGAMHALGFQLAEEASLKALTSEVIKSSAIEGEMLVEGEVRSSVARRLGLAVAGMLPSAKNVDGVVEMVLDATGNFDRELTEARLFGWHAALFPTGHSGMFKIRVAQYRDDAQGPMQVVSGGQGREKVHYEAPPAAVLKSEMAYFLYWFNHAVGLDPVVKAGLAHLWFVTLHPFDDGNGRIGRAVCDMALARADGSSQRFYSLSAQMQRERDDYYLNLERAQKGTSDVTGWLEWFLGCLLRSVQAAQAELEQALYLAHVSRQAPGGALNPRQLLVLKRVMDGFEGKLTTGKWAKIAGCSTDTALRDIQELVALGVLTTAGESKRGAHYLVNTGR